MNRQLLARRFVLVRDRDISGVSGTGVIVEGIQFTDGNVALRWVATHRSTGFYDSVEDVATIHGHDGATRIVWLDSEYETHVDPDDAEGLEVFKQALQ